MKWRINYWYRDGSRMYRGHDIVEASEDFDEDDADELLSQIAQGFITAEGFDVLETSFFKNYTCANFPKTFKVLSVRRVQKHDR